MAPCYVDKDPAKAIKQLHGLLIHGDRKWRMKTIRAFPNFIGGQRNQETTGECTFTIHPETGDVTQTITETSVTFDKLPSNLSLQLPIIRKNVFRLQDDASWLLDFSFPSPDAQGLRQIHVRTQALRPEPKSLEEYFEEKKGPRPPIWIGPAEQPIDYNDFQIRWRCPLGKEDEFYMLSNFEVPGVPAPQARCFVEDTWTK